ncbi:hypothetical protein [Cerasicoccus maritimus]|uniref:hypothetical protein n=1 Tax=Cerasicoccus maritimus TaxID=490089 RepID=UPI0028528883|nr:hypothetical protein [Cerasicoccus maritimus]
MESGIDEKQTEGFDTLEDQNCISPFEHLARSEDDDKVLELLEAFSPDSPEYKIISALCDAPLKRSEILDETGLSADVYEATKKRLRTYLQKKWQEKASVQHKGMEANP